MADSIWAPNPAAQAQSDPYKADTSPHPYLLCPRLWISDHPPEIPDSVLANGPLKPFRPIKISIQRDSPEALDGGGTSGTIEFQTFHSAEKALATISTISLSINCPGDYQPPCSATPLWIRNLPDDIDGGYLFDLFRPFGPLHSVRCIVQGPRDDILGTAKVLYLREESARLARSTMDNTEVEGKKISVIAEPTSRAPPQGGTSTPRKTSAMSATAAPFVPRNSPRESPRARELPSSLPATPPRSVQQAAFNALWTPPNYAAPIPLPAQLNPINGPILPVPGTNLRYSPTQATFIDPCNVYCKNLEHTIDDDALTAIFQDFGEIVSARVITHGENSRGHGFVSFVHPEDAARALAALNGTFVRGRPMYLRLHEPKQPRKNRLARRFGVGDTSESQSDTVDTSNASQPRTPRRAPSNQLTAAVLAGRNRIQSSSANSSLSGRPRVASIDHGLLSSLPEPTRQNHVRDALIRQVSAAPAAQNGVASIRDIVAGLLTLDKDEQVRILMDRDLLDERIVDVNEGRLPAATSPNRAASALGLTGIRGSLEDGSAEDRSPANNGLATEDLPVLAEERQTDPAGSPASNTTSGEERRQLLSAVAGVMTEDSPVEAVTDMLASLCRTDRALCLFNPQYLADKVRDAQRALAIVAGRVTPTGQGANGGTAIDLGFHQRSTENGANVRQHRPVGTQTGQSSFVIPLESLAERNCREIMALVEAANENEATGRVGIHPSELPLGPVTAELQRDADQKLQSVLRERRHVDQKQRLGDLLYHQIKATLRQSKYPTHRGYPGRITIALLEEGIPAGFGEDYEDEENHADQPDPTNGEGSEETGDKGNEQAEEETTEGPPEEAAAGPSGSTPVNAEETVVQAPEDISTGPSAPTIPGPSDSTGANAEDPSATASEETPVDPSASASTGLSGGISAGPSGSTHAPVNGGDDEEDDDDGPPVFGIPPTQQLRRHLDAQRRVLERAEHADHIRCIAQVIALYPELFRLKVVREAQKLGARPLREEV